MFPHQTWPLAKCKAQLAPWSSGSYLRRQPFRTFREGIGLRDLKSNLFAPQPSFFIRTFDDFGDNEFDCRHDMREVHRSHCRTWNRRAEIVFRLPRPIDPVGHPGMVQKHVEQDDAVR